MYGRDNRSTKNLESSPLLFNGERWPGELILMRFQEVIKKIVHFHSMAKARTQSSFDDIEFFLLKCAKELFQSELPAKGDEQIAIYIRNTGLMFDIISSEKTGGDRNAEYFKAMREATTEMAIFSTLCSERVRDIKEQNKQEEPHLGPVITPETPNTLEEMVEEENPTVIPLSLLIGEINPDETTIPIGNQTYSQDEEAVIRYLRNRKIIEKNESPEFTTLEFKLFKLIQLIGIQNKEDLTCKATTKRAFKRHPVKMAIASAAYLMIFCFAIAALIDRFLGKPLDKVLRAEETGINHGIFLASLITFIGTITGTIAYCSSINVSALSMFKPKKSEAEIDPSNDTQLLLAPSSFKPGSSRDHS